MANGRWQLDDHSDPDGLEPESTSEGVSRREMMKLAAGAMIVPALPQTRRRSARKAPGQGLRFFTREELAMVDELTEMIIPADDHSPGARAAKVAQYIDQLLAETWEAELKQQWREGLKLIDALARELHGQPFMQATPQQRLVVLESLAQKETNPQKPEEKFFVELKMRTARGYYTSKIGLHNELEYKGNTYLREFLGEEVK
jgi:hypothetical protein